MSNVVHLNVPSRTMREATRQSALLNSFARHRRTGDDVFWLKENAEVLNILECTGVPIQPEALEAHAGFHAQVEKRMGFFPQYYRFLLSICLDLEDLGIGGNKGEALIDWAIEQQLIEAELSDLQRGEARRLMLRRGRDPIRNDPGLADRLRRFIGRKSTFALPNKKAAYELTHTVFYLSEYGRKDPELDANVGESLDFAGTLAFLDLNADLLAEVCIAMRYGGFTPPTIWLDWLTSHTTAFSVQSDPGASFNDDYHEFLVCNWLRSVEGDRDFAHPVTEGRITFFRPETGQGPLRQMSECLFQEDSRSPDWSNMRSQMTRNLAEDTHMILSQAEAASRDFEAFFAGFARAGAGRLS